MLRQGCSLSMFHKTCENVHGGVSLGGLGMPNISHMPFHLKIHVYYGKQCAQIISVPKDPQARQLLRPIVSSRGLVTYGVGKVLTKILKPLVGKSSHHIHSTQDFVEQANKVTLLHGE